MLPPQEARARAVVKERGSAHQHNKQKEGPRESSRSLLLKVRSPSNSSRGSWKPDRKAESWAQPRAAESDAINEVLQVTRACPSFSSKCWAHERPRSQRASAAPRGVLEAGPCILQDSLWKQGVPASYRTANPLKGILNPADFQTSCWIVVGTGNLSAFI